MSSKLHRQSMIAKSRKAFGRKMALDQAVLSLL